jgi:pantoate--beta-alanine ligase
MLFNMVQPDVAVFGEKDYQQLAVIRKMVQDLFIPVDVIGLPTLRETDGLAMSSRNGFLSASERKVAPALRRVLSETGKSIAEGNDDFAGLEASAADTLAAEGLRPDYFNIVNSLSLKPAMPGDRQITVLAAAFLGTTRLIDNLSVER